MTTKRSLANPANLTDSFLEEQLHFANAWVARAYKEMREARPKAANGLERADECYTADQYLSAIVAEIDRRKASKTWNPNPNEVANSIAKQNQKITLTTEPQETTVRKAPNTGIRTSEDEEEPEKPPFIVLGGKGARTWKSADGKIMGGPKKR